MNSIERIQALAERNYGTAEGFQAGLARMAEIARTGGLTAVERCLANDAYRRLRQRRDATIGTDAERVLRADVAPSTAEAPATAQAPVQAAQRPHPNEGMLPDDAPPGSKLCNGGQYPCSRGRVRTSGYVENGVFKGHEGECFRCCGKGWQSPADQRRNWGFDQNRRIPI